MGTRFLSFVDFLLLLTCEHGLSNHKGLCLSRATTHDEGPICVLQSSDSGRTFLPPHPLFLNPLHPHPVFFSQASAEAL